MTRHEFRHLIRHLLRVMKRHGIHGRMRHAIRRAFL
jgi:hypothetical protein